MAAARTFAGLSGLLLVAACASTPAPPPAPQPVRTALPPRAPAVVTSPAPRDWDDIVATQGEWLRSEESGRPGARFVAVDGSTGFVLRCDPASRRLFLTREGSQPGSGLTIRTSSAARSFPSAGADLPASDQFLDAMVFSRGHFTAEVAGMPLLVLPAWPEPARVVEDCRT